jgi:hypothetical protein
MYTGIVLTNPAEPGNESDIALRSVSLASEGRNEAWLRDFLLKHPSVLPTAAIDPAYAEPIPVCHELRTPAGPLDCLFVTRFGGLVIVECKLWRNPQARREVIGQILDYAKELSAWEYGDLQREVSIARGETATNALFGIVAARYPNVSESEFVDSVSRNLSRGRLMLLLAGDGIREGTESIVQYVSRYAGLHLTFGLIEIVGYEMPDGRLLVQPRVLARTVNVERTVVRVEGQGAGLVEILTPEEATFPGQFDENADVRGDAGQQRTFDPIVLEADRRWRVEFAKRIRFDDPAQAVGRAGYGRVFLELPVQWAWMTAYSSRRFNECGNSVVLKGDPGRDVFGALQIQRPEIEAELTATSEGLNLVWLPAGAQSGLYATRRFPGKWTPEQEGIQLEWLLGATNRFVNTVRPRVLRLLAQAKES